MNNSKLFGNFELAHLNPDSNDILIISFSSWSPLNRQSFFGSNFFIKNNLEALMIRGIGRSNWWHHNDIYSIIKYINKYIINNNKKCILYGSSMGGYAAFHFNSFFENVINSICIAPQIYISKKINSSETRWSIDLSELQNNFVFNEVDTKLVSPTLIFWDPHHSLDSQHISILLNKDLKNINFFEVPYSNHDVARVLVNGKIIQPLISDLLKYTFDFNRLSNQCKNAFYSDPKSFFNYFRKLSFEQIDENILRKFNYHIENSQDLDFEALYFLSDCYLLLKDISRSLLYIEKSISCYQSKFSKDIPNYLLLKLKNVNSKFS